MNAPNEAPALASRFWEHIALISGVVATELLKPGANLWEIQLAVREGVGKNFRAIIADIMAFTLDLLVLPRMGRASGAAPGEPMLSFLAYCSLILHDTQGRKLDDKDFRTRSDELLMENLTAAWLGLYFLGVPFIHPWEKVRRLADYRGGFPSGGCIAKYIGDVYRLARHWAAEQRRPRLASALPESHKEPYASSILVLSHTPLVMLKDALTFKDDSYATPDAVHNLGRYYALLQMLLYIRAGHPVHFLVPATALAQSLDKLAGYPDDPGLQPTPDLRDLRATLLKQVRAWLRDTIFPTVQPGQSVRLLKQPVDAAGMPTCILGVKSGIYTLEAGEKGLHFAGNEIREALLESYRDKLGGLLTLCDNARAGRDQEARDASLLDLEEEKFDGTLAGLVPGR